jgi:hypothetical protein
VLPTRYKYLVEILRDRVTTSEFAYSIDTESSEEALESKGKAEEEEGEEVVEESIERSRSTSAVLSTS